MTTTRRATLTDEQRKVIHEAGAEVARGWIAACADGGPSPGYDFEGDGDWQYVREQARAAGVPWEEDAKQPPASLRDEVWTAAMTGYREALAAT